MCDMDLTDSNDKEDNRVDPLSSRKHRLKKGSKTTTKIVIMDNLARMD